jgi:hypothetical protein
MDNVMTAAGILLALGGLTGIVYGAGINLSGMLARGATDYSFISAYIAEWTFVLMAGLTLAVAGLKKSK